ncbi:MAG: thioredoxin family protein [Desulfobacterales bacterium]|nr:MAG: thioredoxin family protein [Desulfobacterales bacterium]
MPTCNKHHIFLTVLLIFAAVSLADNSFASSGLNSAGDEAVKVSTTWSADRARPGDAIVLAVVVAIKKGYHINADERQLKSFEDFKPIPTEVAVIEAPHAVTIEAPRYPQAVPFRTQYAPGDLMSFEGRTIIYLPIKLEDISEPGSLEFKLGFQYQACTDTYCLFPQKITLSETLAVAKAGSVVIEINKELFKGNDAAFTAATSGDVDFDLFGWTFSIDTTSGFGLALLLITASFGGLLLNFTPCVLPLIPIKIISLSNAAQNRRQCFMLGLTMFLGVLAFWLALGVMIALVSGFSATNQLFQYPAFTIAVGVIIATMATGMFGFFSMRLPNFIYMINPEQDTLHGSFGLGILAAILSTPCTAPFMGAAAAWAATRPPTTTLFTFAAIGTGMALPYLVLSASPRLVEKMPKTGPASVLIKQVMGLLMLAAAAYFIGVGVAALFVSPPNPPSRFYWWPVMLLVIAAGGWLAYRTLQIESGKKTRAFFTGIGVIIMALSAWGSFRLTDKGPIDWVYYTEKRFQEATASRRVVVMVFSAEWCLNCKALEQGVLDDPRIVALFARQEIVPMKVDITGNNPAGKAMLREIGNLTIPLLVIFSPHGKQVFKSDFYTAEQILDAVAGALSKQGA